MNLLRIGRGENMRYLTFEDYIATLSETEKEQYRSLIQEFRERDINLRKNCDELRKNLGKLVREMEACREAMITLEKALQALNAALVEVHWKIYSCAKAASRSEHNGHLFQEYPISLN